MVSCFFFGLDFPENQKPEEVTSQGRPCGGRPFYIPKKKGALILTVTPEEMVEIPGITVPNIRAVLCVQNKVLADRNKVRSGRLVEELLKEAGESRCGHE